MSHLGRRFAAIVAASAAAMTGLLCLVSASAPVGAPARPVHSYLNQETAVDLSTVESAPEYRTDEPRGPGFLGSEAAVLGRSLARINKALGTSLKPDNRLARLARWVYERLGPGGAMPPQSAFDLVTHRVGLAEPLPHLLMMQAPDAPRLANVVSSRLARVFDLTGYTHIGGVAEIQAHGVVVVIALSRRHIQMGPVPRSLSAPGRIKLEGRLIGAYTKPELARTLPGGETRIEALGKGPEFSATVELAQVGRHRLEIVAQGKDGPDVIANFPVFVGVPVDEAIGETAAAVPRSAVRPDEAQQRLFELINRERSKAGLDALTLDPELGKVALGHSEDMRANDFVAHVSPTTGSVEQRLLRAGIVTDLAAENVGKGYSPDEIHTGFMDSPGHRAAILLPDATHIGIGIALKKENDRASYLVTELFIRRIPQIGPDAKVIFLMELNGLREPGGAPALEEDPVLTRLAEEAAGEYLNDQALSQADVLQRLARRMGRSDLKLQTAIAVFAVVGSLEEGAKQAASDPRGEKARRVGIGIAQGARPGLIPNSIVLVLIFAD